MKHITSVNSKTLLDEGFKDNSTEKVSVFSKPYDGEEGGSLQVFIPFNKPPEMHYSTDQEGDHNLGFMFEFNSIEELQLESQRLPHLVKDYIRKYKTGD